MFVNKERQIKGTSNSKLLYSGVTGETLPRTIALYYFRIINRTFLTVHFLAIRWSWLQRTWSIRGHGLLKSPQSVVAGTALEPTVITFSVYKRYLTKALVLQVTLRGIYQKPKVFKEFLWMNVIKSKLIQKMFYLWFLNSLSISTQLISLTDARGPNFMKKSDEDCNDIMTQWYNDLMAFSGSCPWFYMILTSWWPPVWTQNLNKTDNPSL